MNSSLFPTSDSADSRQIITVSALNSQIRDCLQGSFPSVWVSGEVTDLARPQSGHIYLSLKDDQGQLKAVMWRATASRLGFDLQDGMQVLCQGQVDVYPPRGTFQLIIRKIEPQGLGTLQLALQKLRDRLAAEGLFEQVNKRALPRFPRHIAVVTSPTGAAVRDFMEVVKRRWPGSHVTVVPTRVQGEGASDEIVNAIRISQELRPRPDVLVVTRGGGSLEDLWSFNEEAVVREIFAATVPVVSAIGHEIDVTLADLVADVRALTPTEAGERVVPSSADVAAELHNLLDRMNGCMSLRFQTLKARLDGLASRPALMRPEQPIIDLTQRVDELSDRMSRGLESKLSKTREQLGHFSQQLDALSPLAVLSRGYSLTQRADDGRLIRETSELKEGDVLYTRLGHGAVTSRVTSMEAAVDNAPSK